MNIRLILIGLALLAVLILLGVLEKRRNEAALSKLTVRVNVNGICGKSTATRLITAILQEAGYRVVGKTTGTAARMFAWDCPEEEEIHRYPHGVSISEQLKVIRSAAKRGANALVCECMAVKPEYQRVYQQDIIKANLTVIVNVLEDHLDEMGPTTTQIAWAFGETIPYHGKVVLPDCEFTEYFKTIARERDTQVFIADDTAVDRRYLDLFSYRLFEHNCAVALAAAEALGIERDVALRGMLRAAPDPGALQFHEIDGTYGRFTLVNAFAANEPSSSLEIWQLVEQEIPEHDEPLVILNCRPDRVDRTHQFVRDFIPRMPPCVLVTVGENTASVGRAYRRGKFPNVRSYLDFGGQSASQILPGLAPLLPGKVVLCVGNIHGTGEPLIDALVKTGQAVDKEPAPAL